MEKIDVSLISKLNENLSRLVYEKKNEQEVENTVYVSHANKLLLEPENVTINFHKLSKCITRNILNIYNQN